jgi:hypothetical protein
VTVARSSEVGITVMMPAFNAARFIGEAIDSVRQQAASDWELLVIDDGSTDDTAKVAESFHDARIQVIRQDNQGEATSRNRALSLARGEFLAFLDADDAYLPSHLRRTADCLRENPDAVGVFTDGYHVGEDGTRLKPLSARRRPPRSGDVFDEIVYGSDFLGPPVCVVLRRGPILAQALRFDARIVMGPDWDFFMRVAALGPFMHVDEATCLYRVHTNSITTSLDARARMRERAKCRERAVEHPRFNGCAAPVRANVFHDLLVVALRGEPGRQRAVLEWPAFGALPARERAWLFRLLADEAMVLGYEPSLVRAWLRASRRANPRDWKTAALWSLYAATPAACTAFIRRRRAGFEYSIDRPPFEDLGLS